MGSFLLLILAVGAMYFMHGRGGGCCGGGHGHDHSQTQQHDSMNQGSMNQHYSSKRRDESASCHTNSGQINGQKLFRDPVCGSYVSEEIALKKTVGGTIYYFCCQDCLDEFMEIPKREDEEKVVI